ncbi:talin-1 isoform X2 [Diaphorina citri]|uniref:Talin-1 isoform X1 n=1 Tax=Diaphorina citri TaxID=121845 RepID=A0A3Q0ILZ7_DIACI|nr:talin-1 isoform X1 [Diaphorina citri]XP_026677337.1 talin-1 isoform X2 [Diaphorina citri]
MATLSLKICIVDRNVTKTMQFDPSTSVYDACRIIRDKISEANFGEAKDYGLFLSDGDVKKGVWLEPGRNLEYYILRNGDELEYRRKMRTLKVRMLDGTLKTLLVDDSQPVANLMVVICTKIGITNHDEYSLVRENPEDEVENKPNFGTLTLKRKKEEKERDLKMEQLRKKLKTDDEVNWIDFSKTLREQGIDENEPVLLRRKFFFSDGNIDSHDPVQLNLLYVQARDAVLDGTHPVTQDLACQLAGIQTHIQFGDYNPSKHKPPFLDLKEFLPQSYVKVKGIEKKIFSEHKNHVGLSELDAKVLYTKTCRSLPTYGVTFFLVKEKMKGKNKLVPRLLGVTKDSVLRLDERTKEIMKTWPLTTVRRWGASSNVFTLDFGDYSDNYYSVQTTEAEQIQQLIAGYIDIILKKKMSKDHFGIEGDEGSTMVEDSVSPLKATIFQHESNRVGKVNTESVAKPAVMRAGNDGARPYGVGHVGSAQYTTVSGQINIAHSPTTTQQSQVTNILTGSQKALLSTITEGHEVITTVEKELISKAIIPDLGNDAASLKWKETTVDANKHNVSSQIAAMNAATAQVVTMTSGEVTDYSGVESAITSISHTLPEMSKGVRMLAALTPSGDELLDAARKLCFAFTDLLKAAQPHSNQPRQNLLNAATRVGEASHHVLTEIGESQTNEMQDTLLSLAKAVANTTAALVLKAKSVASTLPPNQQTSVITSATKCALATSQLVACTKVVAPTLENPACQQQLMAAVKEVANAVEGLVAMCNETCTDENLNKDLTKAAAEVTKTLNQLLNHIKVTTTEPAQDVETAVEVMMSSSDRLLAASGDAPEMVRQARILGQATAQLIQAIKGDAENEPDSELQRRLLAAAKNLAEATARMVEAARQCASHPQDIMKQEALVTTVEELRQAATPTLRYKLFNKSQTNEFEGLLPGQQEIEEITEIIESTYEQIHTDDFPRSTKPIGRLQQELSSAATGLSETTNEVISSVKNPANLPASSKQYSHSLQNLVDIGMEIISTTESRETQTKMLSSLKSVSTSSSKFLSTARSAALDPSASNSKSQLSAAARNVADSINNLLNICTSALPGQKECDNAIRNIQSMKPFLDKPTEPINDMSYYECHNLIMEKSKSLGEGMTGMANHAKHSEYDAFGKCVNNVSDSICGLCEGVAQASYLVAISEATSNTANKGLIDQTQFSRAANAIKHACNTLTNPSTTQQQILTAATVIAKHTSSLCNACRIASSKTTNPVAKRHFVQSAKDVANSTANLVQEIKALDMNYNEKNHQVCTQATKPLLDAVDSLVSFAYSPEFVNRSSHFGDSTLTAQEPILSAGEAIIESSCSMIKTAKSLAVSPKDRPTWKLLADHSKQVSDSIKRLVTSIRDVAPGQKECDQAIEAISSRLRELDEVAMLAVSQGQIPHYNSASLQMSAEKTEQAANEILTRLEPLRQAAKYQAESIAFSVNQLVTSFDSLASDSMNVASNLIHSKQQMTLLDQTKTVAECLLQVLHLIKEAGGNPDAVNIHPDLDESIEATKEALSDITSSLDHFTGVVNTFVDSITKSMQQIPDPNQPSSHYASDSVDSYVDYHTRMVGSSKEIARISQEMMTKSWSDVKSMSGLSSQLTHQYSKLCTDCIGAVASASNPEVSGRLCGAVHDLGTACINTVTMAATCQTSGDDYTHREFADTNRVLAEKVSQVLYALQAGSRGTQACINAASTVSGIIGDLDTTIMFATAGTLHAEKENDTFADHRENILKTAKALVEDTKTLVAGAASSQEQLAVAAQNAVSTIVQLAEVVKFGAASLGSNNPEAQVLLINAVKDVTTALGDLIQATKAASGKTINDPCMNHLKESAKVMVTNVTSLLKTVKAVEDEHTRGTRALESTIEAIAQEIRALNSVEQVKSTASPEELVRCTKPITQATAKAVAAGNSCKQEDVIVAANMGRKAISDMLAVCKGCSNAAETHELCVKTLDAGQEVAVQYRELLQTVLHILSRPGDRIADSKQALPPISRRIAQSLTELVSIAEQLKGSNWMDPDDPTVIAETELLGAAASIDAAAKKLSSLRPRRSLQETDETLNFDEMILEAAKSIAAATSALVKAASASQRELIDAGRMSRRPLTSSDDGQWSEGLISAARLVAAATHTFVEAANSVVQGAGTEEKLISSAKQVASSTAQLLVACKVKADPESDATHRLQSAGNAVKRATDNLVRAAQQAIQQDEERSLVLNRKMVGGIAQEINARSEVLRIERQLEEARGRLTAIRQAKYKLKGGDGSASDTEPEMYEPTYNGVVNNKSE